MVALRLHGSLGFSHAVRVLLLVVSTSPAWAFTAFPGRIPNGRINKCINCHTTPEGGTQRNLFGDDVSANIRNGYPNWSVLYALDSDGDGFTNGEEMGDPCGQWQNGQVPALTQATLPGNASSKPEQHANMADCPPSLPQEPETPGNQADDSAEDPADAAVGCDALGLKDAWPNSFALMCVVGLWRTKRVRTAGGRHA